MDLECERFLPASTDFFSFLILRSPEVLFCQLEGHGPSFLECGCVSRVIDQGFVWRFCIASELA